MNISYHNLKPVIREFIIKHKLNGNTKNPRFFLKLAKKGLIYNINKNDTETAISFAKQIDSMTTVLNSLYNKEDWDFDFRWFSGTNKSGFTIQINILYKEFTITNKNNENHKIKDLLVVIPLYYEEDKKIFYPGTIKGTRISFSQTELLSGYRHSHLTSLQSTYSNTTIAGDFCLGSGTEVVHSLNNLVLEYNEDNFIMFLLNVNALVEYESLEGGPYIRIKNIVKHSNQKITNEKNKDFNGNYPAIYNTLDMYIKDSYEKIDIKIYFKNGFLQIDKKIFENSLKKLIINRLPEKFYEYIFLTKIRNEYFKISNNNLRVKEFYEVNKNKYFYINSKKLTFNVYEIKEKQIEWEKYSIHPILIDELIEKIKVKILIDYAKKDK